MKWHIDESGKLIAVERANGHWSDGHINSAARGGVKAKRAIARMQFYSREEAPITLPEVKFLARADAILKGEA